MRHPAVKAFLEHPAHAQLHVQNPDGAAIFRPTIDGVRRQVPSVSRIIREHVGASVRARKRAVTGSFTPVRLSTSVSTGGRASGGRGVHQQVADFFALSKDELAAKYGGLERLDTRAQALIAMLRKEGLRVFDVERFLWARWGGARVDALALRADGAIVAVEFKTCASIAGFIQATAQFKAPLSAVYARRSAFSAAALQVGMAELMLRETYGVRKTAHVVLAVSVKEGQVFRAEERKWAREGGRLGRALERRYFGHGGTAAKLPGRRVARTSRRRV